jgi:hypothetical protein
MDSRSWEGNLDPRGCLRSTDARLCAVGARKGRQRRRDLCGNGLTCCRLVRSCAQCSASQSSLPSWRLPPPSPLAVFCPRSVLPSRFLMPFHLSPSAFFFTGSSRIAAVVPHDLHQPPSSRISYSRGVRLVTALRCCGDEVRPPEVVPVEAEDLSTCRLRGSAKSMPWCCCSQQPVFLKQRALAQRSSSLHMSCPLTPMGANVIVTVEEKKGDGQVRGFFCGFFKKTILLIIHRGVWL